MRKPLAILFIVFITLSTGSIVRAQTTPLKNTAWKFYVEALNDSLTYHFDADTSWAASSSGESVVKSLWKTSNDTLRINDVNGMYPCHDGEGVYRYVIDGDVMTWILLSDPCSDRAASLSNVKFIRKK